MAEIALPHDAKDETVILSAVSYLASTIPQFAAEAAALRDWRDATWAEVVRAQAEVSSQGELIARLPPPPARPTV